MPGTIGVEGLQNRRGERIETTQFYHDFAERFSRFVDALSTRIPDDTTFDQTQGVRVVDFIGAFSHSLDDFYTTAGREGFNLGDVDKITIGIRNNIDAILARKRFKLETEGRVTLFEDLKLGEYFQIRQELLRALAKQPLIDKNLYDAQVLFRALRQTAAGKLSDGLSKKTGNPVFVSDDIEAFTRTYPQLKNPSTSFKPFDLSADLSAALDAQLSGIGTAAAAIVHSTDEYLKKLLSFDEDPASPVPPSRLTFFEEKILPALTLLMAVGGTKVIREQAGHLYDRIVDMLKRSREISKDNPAEGVDLEFDGWREKLRKKILGPGGRDFEVFIQGILDNPRGAGPNPYDVLDEMIRMLDEQEGLESGYLVNQSSAEVEKNKEYLARQLKFLRFWKAKARAAADALRAASVYSTPTSAGGTPPTPPGYPPAGAGPGGGATPPGGGGPGTPGGGGTGAAAAAGSSPDHPEPGMSEVDIAKFFLDRYPHVNTPVHPDYARENRELLDEVNNLFDAMESSERSSLTTANKETVAQLRGIIQLFGGESSERGRYIFKRIRIYDAAFEAGASFAMVMSYKTMREGGGSGEAHWPGVNGNALDESDFDYFLEEWDHHKDVVRVVETFAKLFGEREWVNPTTGVTEANPFYGPNYEQTKENRNLLWETVGSMLSGVDKQAVSLGIYLAINLDIRRHFSMSEYARGWSPSHDFAATKECIEILNPHAEVTYVAAGKGADWVNFAYTFAEIPEEWTEFSEFDLGAHKNPELAEDKRKNIMFALEATELHEKTHGPVIPDIPQMRDRVNPCPDLYEFFILRRSERKPAGRKQATLKDYFKGFYSFGELYKECEKPIALSGSKPEEDRKIILDHIRHIREDIYSGSKALGLIDTRYRAYMLLSCIVNLFREYNLKYSDEKGQDVLIVAVKKLIEGGITFSGPEFVDSDGKRVDERKFLLKRFPLHLTAGFGKVGLTTTFNLPIGLRARYDGLFRAHPIDTLGARVAWDNFKRKHPDIALPEAAGEKEKKK